MKTIEGKIAFITGAGSGMGQAVAVEYARQGAILVITDINQDGLHDTLRMVEDVGGNATAIVLDVTNENDWAQAAHTVEENLGHVDILYQAAGILIAKPLTETTLEEWNLLMDINVTGVFLGMKHIIPLMGAGGSIINTSSDAGMYGCPNCSLYGASKGAVRLLSKHVAAEYAGQGIRINTIHPGYVKTPMVKDYSDEELVGSSPLGIFGMPDEIAGLAVFLGSDDSRYMTGSELVLDGGNTFLRV